MGPSLYSLEHVTQFTGLPQIATEGAIQDQLNSVFRDTDPTVIIGLGEMRQREINCGINPGG